MTGTVAVNSLDDKDFRKHNPRFTGAAATANTEIAQAVQEVAEAKGVTQAQIALAWLLSKPVVTAPIVGATKLHYLDDAIAAVNVKLSGAEIAALEELYVPHAVVGFD